MVHRQLSGPVVLNVEITDLCNERCRHCFNFDRDLSLGSEKFSYDQFDRLLEQAISSNVFHVVLSGGEPFLNFDILEYGIRKLTEANITTSVNSNLSVVRARQDRLERLAAAGLDHILTSLPSCDASITDDMVNAKGAFERIRSGIIEARNAGIRVSANMVVSDKNKHTVYDTAVLAYELGCQKIFGTRTVTPHYMGASQGGLVLIKGIGSKKNTKKRKQTEEETLQVIARREALGILDQLIEAKNDIGIMIGSLVSYPLCMLGDLERYRDFVGRGCPTQRGHRMSLTANGDIYACPHDDATYGNVFKDGIIDAYDGQRGGWLDGGYRHSGCSGCEYSNMCDSGCRMDAKGFTGSMSGRDPMMIGPIVNGVINNDPSIHHRPYQIVRDPKIISRIESGARFFASERLRFRKENGFYLMSIRWANVIEIDNKTAEFLMEYQTSGKSFTYRELGEDKLKDICDLFFTGAIEFVDSEFSDSFDSALSIVGTAADPVNVPVT